MIIIPIRVLHVVPAMNCGGMETFIMNMYRNIDRSKIQFDFLYHYENECFYDEEIRSLGGNIYKLSIRNDNDFLKYFRDLDGFFATHKEYKVIHGHFSGFGMFYNHYARKHGIAHRFGHSHSDKYEVGLIGQLDRFMSKPFRYGVTDRFACSEAAGRFLFGSHPFQVLMNGINAADFRYDEELGSEMREKYAIRPTDIVIGHVGRFDPVKNHDFLLNVFAKLHQDNPNFRLALVGDGALRAEAENQAKQLGIHEAVCFLGLQKNVAAFYNLFDLFVLPSHFEGIPLSLVEAQANGLACVVSDRVNTAADLTGHMTMLPLDTDSWYRHILNADPMRHADAFEKVCAAGYDIRMTAEKLQDLYIQYG